MAVIVDEKVPMRVVMESIVDVVVVYRMLSKVPVNNAVCSESCL